MFFLPPLYLLGCWQGAITNSWHYRWNLSFYASRGYGVVAVNFHGSTGFGQAYVDSIRHDWGGQPFRDCLEGVRRVLAEKPYLDKSRVGALGASYGEEEGSDGEDGVCVCGFVCVLTLLVIHVCFLLSFLYLFYYLIAWVHAVQCYSMLCCVMLCYAMQ